MQQFNPVCAAVLAAGLMAAIPAPAAVNDVSATGFTIVETAEISASPDQVYRALATPSRWWNSEHTFSGDAANLSLDPRAGGCWCETLPGGGSTQHMVVVNAMPGKMLRLRGGLGPLQAMAVDGVMTFALKPDGDKTRLTMSYAAGGYSKGGFSDIASAVDGVLGEQVLRLQLFVETGSPQRQSKE